MGYSAQYLLKGRGSYVQHLPEGRGYCVPLLLEGRGDFGFLGNICIHQRLKLCIKDPDHCKRNLKAITEARERQIGFSEAVCLSGGTWSLGRVCVLASWAAG